MTRDFPGAPESPPERSVAAAELTTSPPALPSRQERPLFVWVRPLTLSGKPQARIAVAVRHIVDMRPGVQTQAEGRTYTPGAYLVLAVGAPLTVCETPAAIVAQAEGSERRPEPCQPG